MCELIITEQRFKDLLPDSNVIFFVATKKTKQKKSWVRFIDIVTYVLDSYIGAALGMFCTKDWRWPVPDDWAQSTYAYPLMTRPLRSSTAVLFARLVLFIFSLQKNSTARLPETGRILLLTLGVFCTKGDH
jgi:hypothetical protein